MTNFPVEDITTTWQNTPNDCLTHIQIKRMAPSDSPIFLTTFSSKNCTSTDDGYLVNEPIERHKLQHNFSIENESQRPIHDSNSNIITQPKRVQLSPFYLTSSIRSSNTTDDFSAYSIDKDNSFRPEMETANPIALTTAPTPTKSQTSIQSMPWSAWVKNRIVKATAQIASSNVNGNGNGHHTQKHPFYNEKGGFSELRTSSVYEKSPILIAAKPFFASSPSSICPTTPSKPTKHRMTPPVKGILKSRSQSTRSHSLDDCDNGGGSFNTGTSKSITSHSSSKKRVKFSETDTIASVLPYDFICQWFHSTADDNDTFEPGDIIDGYKATKEFSLVFDREVDDDSGENKFPNAPGSPTSYDNITLVPFRSSKVNIGQNYLDTSDSQYVSKDNEKNYQSIHKLWEKSNMKPIAPWDYNNVGNNRRSYTNIKDSRDLSENKLSALSDLYSISVYPPSTSSENKKKPAMKFPRSFASLPRRPKSKHSFSPSQSETDLTSYPTDSSSSSSNQTYSRVQMSPNIEHCQKVFRRGFLTLPAENNKMAATEWDGRSSFKGQKYRPKDPATSVK